MCILSLVLGKQRILGDNYSVTFASPGADTAANPTSMSVKSPAITVEALPSDPVKDGNVFDGWYTEQNGNGELFTASTLVDGDITVYANWSTLYSITYIGNNNTSGQAPERQRGENGDKITLQSQGNLERIGYTFNGWNTNADGSGTDYSAGANHTISGNLVLYAKWTANVYQITYKDKGGTAFSGVHGNNYPRRHTYGRSTTLVNPTKDGYRFGGWYTDISCTGDTIAQIILYAKWDVLYTITYNSNDADYGFSAVPSAQQGVGGEQIVVQYNAYLRRTGYRFGGWNTKSDGTGITYAEGSKYTLETSNVTLYAKWDFLYTITYNSNGADEGDIPSPQRGISGERIVVQANNGNLAKTGYRFGGWNTKADGTGTNYVAGTSKYILETSDVTLYAKWNYLFDPGNYIAKANLEVGDIVLQNGKYVSYATFEAYATEIMTITQPAGIVCYKGETGAVGTTGKVYMMGLDEGKWPKWAPSETAGYNTKFNTSNTAGEGNWAIIIEADESGSKNAAVNYPAFDYANTYTVAGYTNGWFLPAINELSRLHTNRTTISKSIVAIKDAGGTASASLSLGAFWSSSQDSSDGSQAYSVVFNSGDTYNYDKNYNCDVLVVRALDD